MKSTSILRQSIRSLEERVNVLEQKEELGQEFMEKILEAVKSLNKKDELLMSPIKKIQAEK